MPDAFDQFFKLMGTTAEKELKLVRLDPAYQTRNEGKPDKLLIRDNVAENKKLFESLESGAGERLQQYLDSAEETYALAKQHFLYTNFQNTKTFSSRPAVS
jgi:phytoene dehydrogenase-like protein